MRHATVTYIDDNDKRYDLEVGYLLEPASHPYPEEYSIEEISTDSTSLQKQIDKNFYKFADSIIYDVIDGNVWSY